MEKFKGYFCPKCNCVITNMNQIHWEKQGVVSIPKCNYHKVKVDVNFEEKMFIPTETVEKN